MRTKPKLDRQVEIKNGIGKISARSPERPFVRVQSDGCWLWVRQINNYGYGHIHRTRRGLRFSQLAHRLTYADVHGPIPEGYEIDHLCRNRACVNPAHLEAVSRSTNQRRRLDRKMTFAKATALKAGLRDGRSKYSLAREYGISETTVRQIAIGLIWKDVV